MTPHVEMGFVETSAGHIHYRAAGSGHPVLLMHINQQSSAMLLELLAVLGREFRVLALDLPGHGHSDHVAEQPSIRDYARWYVEVLDRLSIARASVLGEANGAVVAIELAAAFPDRIASAMLVNCPYYVERANLRERLLPMREATLPADSTGFPAALTIEFMLEKDPGHSPMRPTQDWMDRLNVAHMEAGRDRWQGFDALHEYDIDASLHRVQCPVLLMTGEHFPYAEHREEIVSRLRNVKSTVIHGARFCATWEFHEEVGGLATEFLMAAR